MTGDSAGTILATARAAPLPGLDASRSHKPRITAGCKECKRARWMSQLFLLYSLAHCSAAAGQPSPGEGGQADNGWPPQTPGRARSRFVVVGGGGSLCRLPGLVRVLAPPSRPSARVGLSPCLALRVVFFFFSSVFRGEFAAGG